MIHKSLPSPYAAPRHPLVVAAMSGKQGTQLQGVWEGAEANQRFLVPLLLVDEDLLLNTNFHTAQCAAWVSDFNWKVLGGGAMVFVMIHKSDANFVDGMLRLAEELMDGSESDYQVALYVTGFATNSDFVHDRIAAWSRYEEVSLFTAEQYSWWIEKYEVRRQVGNKPSPLGHVSERKVV